MSVPLKHLSIPRSGGLKTSPLVRFDQGVVSYCDSLPYLFPPRVRQGIALRAWITSSATIIVLHASYATRSETWRAAPATVQRMRKMLAKQRLSSTV